MSSIYRQQGQGTNRLTGGNLAPQITGGQSQVITSEFWEAPAGQPITGTIVIAQQAQVCAVQGILEFLGLVGTIQRPQTCAASGQITVLPVSGTVLVNQKTQTIVAAGSLAFLGNFAASQRPVLTAGSGTVQNPVFAGNITAIQQPQTCAAQGILGQVLSGTFASTLRLATMQATGSIAATQEAPSLYETIIVPLASLSSTRIVYRSRNRIRANLRQRRQRTNAVGSVRAMAVGGKSVMRQGKQALDAFGFPDMEPWNEKELCELLELIAAA